MRGCLFGKESYSILFYGLRDLDDDVEEIGDGALVLYLVDHQLLGEGVVDRVLIVVRVDGEHVVDVAAEDQGLVARAARRLDGLAPAW